MLWNLKQKNDEWEKPIKVTKLKNNDNISNNNGDKNDNTNDKNININSNDKSNNKIIIIVIIKILILSTIKKRSNQHISNVVEGVGGYRNIKTIFSDGSSKGAAKLCVYNNI